MGLKIVTGRTGTPHVSSNQIQAFNRSLLGDLAILDLGQHFDAVVRDANTIRIYDGCIVVQGIYAVIPHDEYEDVLVEPVSVGNTRIDTIYLHYAKDMETDTETVELDIAQGEEAVNNPVKPDIDAGGDTWEGTTDIRIPLYDVTVTSFETTIVPYEYMNVYSPTISELQERIPETTVSGVKGDAESKYRSGNVNITPTNIGLGNVDNTADTDKPVSTAQQEALDGKVDKVTGKGLSTNDYTNEEKQKNTDNASAIEDIQEDISQSLSATGNPITIESSESNLVECVAEVEPIQDLHGYDHPWVGGAGKNLYIGSPSFDGYAQISGWTKQTETYNGHDVYKRNSRWGGAYKAINLATGTYTFSAMVKVGSACNIHVFALLENVATATLTPENKTVSLLANTWTRVDFTFEVTTAGRLALRVENGNNDIDTYISEYQLEAGNQATSYEPYSNISPITGQTEVVIEDCGENISTGVEQGSFDTNGVNGSSNTRCRSIGYIPVTTGTEYILNCKPDNVYASISYFANNTNIERISGTTWESLPYKFTPPSNCRYIRVMFSFDAGAQTNITSSDILNLIIADNPKTYRVEIGQKNKLPMTVDGIKSANTSGTWNGNVYTWKNITYELITDVSGNIIGINTNGTTSADSYLILEGWSDWLPKDTEYILSGCPAGGNVDSSYCLMFGSVYTGQTQSNYYDIGSGISIQSRDNEVCRIYVKNASNKLFKPMIRTTIDDSTFVPYNPNLPDAIYGGELDVLTGKLRVTHGYAEFDGSSDENWAKYSSGSASAYAMQTTLSNLIAVSDDDKKVKIIANELESVAYNGAWGEYDAFVCKNNTTETSGLVTGVRSITTVADWKTYLASNPLQVVYELATPYTIQLTPQQIRLLKGINHLSCNTGDLSIKYYPDNVLGQLKGDIESEYDERIVTLEEKANTPTIKQVEINRNAVSTDGSVMFTALTGHIIVGTSISNDANSNKCVGIPYSMGTVPALKIMNESTMAVLPNITISGILYCIEL